MIKDAEKFKKNDEEVKDTIEAKNRLDSYVSSIKRTIENPEFKTKLGQIFGEEKFAEVFMKIVELEDKIDANDNEIENKFVKDDFDKFYSDLEAYVLPIIKDVMSK